MRLFVALVPPPGALADLDAAIAPLRGPDARWTPVESWHVTLVFLGEVGDPGPVQAGLAEVAARTAPLGMQLRGAGRFGDRVLWAGVGGAIDRLGALAATTAAAARAAGIEVEDRPFRPHLTLARGRARMEPLVRTLRRFESRGWTADRLHLVESRPGPVYTDLATWPLTGP